MQRGIASALILILIAIVIGLTAVGFGYFVIQNSSPKKEVVTLPPENLIPPPTVPVGTPGCPDADYTGCDNTSRWATWDGNIAQDSEVKIDSTGTIYSK